MHLFLHLLDEVIGPNLVVEVDVDVTKLLRRLRASPHCAPLAPTTSLFPLAIARPHPLDLLNDPSSTGNSHNPHLHMGPW